MHAVVDVLSFDQSHTHTLSLSLCVSVPTRVVISSAHYSLGAYLLVPTSVSIINIIIICLCPPSQVESIAGFKLHLFFSSDYLSAGRIFFFLFLFLFFWSSPFSDGHWNELLSIIEGLSRLQLTRDCPPPTPGGDSFIMGKQGMPFTPPHPPTSFGQLWTHVNKFQQTTEIWRPRSCLNMPNRGTRRSSDESSARQISSSYP